MPSGNLISMKLIRFELKADPSKIRSGIVQAGKVYETEGGQGVGVHEAALVRPLIPVAKTTSVRIFHREFQPDALQQMEMEDFHYFVGNPGSLIGPSQIVPYPYWTDHLTVVPYLAAVVLGDAWKVDIQYADELILGVTIMAVLVAHDTFQQDRKLGRGMGRSYDVAAAFGPVLTTPEELDGSVTNDEVGRRYELESVVRINGVEKTRGNSVDLPLTLAQAIQSASQGAPLREGDIVAIGPLVDEPELVRIDPEDEIQVAVESLGAISIKMDA